MRTGNPILATTRCLAHTLGRKKRRCLRPVSRSVTWLECYSRTERKHVVDGVSRDHKTCTYSWWHSLLGSVDASIGCSPILLKDSKYMLSPVRPKPFNKHPMSASPGFALRKDPQCDTSNHPCSAAQQCDSFLTIYPELALFILQH